MSVYNPRAKAVIARLRFVFELHEGRLADAVEARASAARTLLLFIFDFFYYYKSRHPNLFLYKVLSLLSS